MHTQYPVAQNSAWARPPKGLITAKFMMCQYVYCKWEKIWNKALLPIRHPIQEFTTRQWAKTTTSLYQYYRRPSRESNQELP